MDDDLVERLRDRGTASNDPAGAKHLMLDAADELERLRQWKKEATYVIDMWEQVWTATGQPGPVGGLKSENISTEFNRLKALEARVLSAPSAFDDAIAWLLDTPR